MSFTVTALYDTREEAARALEVLQTEVPIRHANIYDSSPASLDALQRLDLTPEEQSACEQKLASGEYMLLAQPGTGAEPERIISVLERIAYDDLARPEPEPLQPQTDSMENGSTVSAPQRSPVMEGELRVGTPLVLRGGASVRTSVNEVPVPQESELIETFAQSDARPAQRRITEQDLDQAGLLRPRAMEFAQVGEEAVIRKEAVVREEVVVSKTTEHRAHQIHDTVRRTQVETEELDPESADRR
jgi:hypothetical protein